MASWREIDRIRKDAAAVRSIAERLLAFHSGDFTEWELIFLESMARRESPDDLSTRQVEKLLEIRDGAEFISDFFPFNVLLQAKTIPREDLFNNSLIWCRLVWCRLR